MKLVWFVFLTLTLSSCGTYRGASSGYASNQGGWRTSSDYNYDPSAREYQVRSGAPEAYIPNGEFRLFWPVGSAQLSRGFRPASDPRHEGIDLRGSRGTPVLSAHEGKVIYTGRDFRGYGNMVIVEYSAAWATLYAHLNEITTRQGTLVKPGDPLGTMGSSGKATGVHLHFEVINERKPVDPLPLLNHATQVARRGRR